MSDFKIQAWVFIDFGTHLWKNPKEARSQAQWEVVRDYNEALNKAEQLGMSVNSLFSTSSDGTKRMVYVSKSELEGIEDWDLYVRSYIDKLTESLEGITPRCGCMCGVLSSMLGGGSGQAELGCGCGTGCACGSSESCKCEEGG